MEVKKICVLGAGLMGNGIAQVCAQAGYIVSMRDIEQRFLDSGMDTIKKNLGRSVEKQKMSQEDMNAALSRITPMLDLKEVTKDADLVIEVVPEIIQHDADDAQRAFQIVDDHMGHLLPPLVQLAQLDVGLFQAAIALFQVGLMCL